MTLIKSLFIPFLFLISTASHSATCQNTDVTADISGGFVYANACINKIGNDNQMNGQPFANTINAEFGITGNWSQLATNNAVGELEISSGMWDFSSLAASISNPFVLTIKSSNEFAAYLFNAATLGTGTFTTAGLEPNQNGRDQNISHYSIYTSNISQVPVPAALWLFAPALIGLLGLRRRQL